MDTTTKLALALPSFAMAIAIAATGVAVAEQPELEASAADTVTPLIVDDRPAPTPAQAEEPAESGIEDEPVEKSASDEVPEAIEDDGETEACVADDIWHEDAVYGQTEYEADTVPVSDETWHSASDFMSAGIYSDGEWTYTWYSQNVLPGGGLDIPGRHVDEEGYVVDAYGNLCVASDDLPYGTVVEVPFGSGTAVVYDCGGGYGNLDIYTAW